jgi:hypothetical protein
MFSSRRYVLYPLHVTASFEQTHPLLGLFSEFMLPLLCSLGYAKYCQHPTDQHDKLDRIRCALAVFKLFIRDLNVQSIYVIHGLDISIKVNIPQ